jgi:hypothetical protein
LNSALPVTTERPSSPSAAASKPRFNLHFHVPSKETLQVKAARELSVHSAPNSPQGADAPRPRSALSGATTPTAATLTQIQQSLETRRASGSMTERRRSGLNSPSAASAVGPTSSSSPSATASGKGQFTLFFRRASGIESLGSRTPLPSELITTSERELVMTTVNTGVAATPGRTTTPTSGARPGTRPPSSAGWQHGSSLPPVV